MFMSLYSLIKRKLIEEMPSPGKGNDFAILAGLQLTGILEIKSIIIMAGPELQNILQP
jgi:hypothetical protein